MKLKNTTFLLLMLPAIFFAQHTIKVNFSPAKDFTWGIIYKSTPTSNKYIAQGKIENGTLLFKLDEKATKGIYKIVYAVPQLENNFDVIYNGEEDIEVNFNVTDGAVFQKSSENKMLSAYLNDFILLGKDLEKAYTQQTIDSTAVTEIYKRQEALQRMHEEQTKGKLVFHFIKANKPYIPQNYKTPEIYIENLIDNYFSNIDFNDTVLQSSNFLIEKSFTYIVGITPDGIDKLSAYNQNIDKISTISKGTDPTFQKKFLEHIRFKLIIYNLIDTANYLSEWYLIPLAKQLNDTALVTKLIQYQNISIGNVAPDFSWDTIENGASKTYKLRELGVAENYILVFWSSTCSHCLKQIPQLQQFVKQLNSTKYKVVAVGLEDEPTNWQREIKKYPEFIHAIQLKKWESSVVKDYALTSTPSYFVLDVDKKFIAKPENLEELENYLEKNK